MGLTDVLKGWTISAASSPPAGPLPSPSIPIASPWADGTALEVATWAGLLDAIECMPVTRAQCIALPAVARGQQLICPPIARFDFYGVNSGGRMPVQPRIVAQPERGRSRFVTILWTVDSMLFEGFAVWQITERYLADNRPMAVRYVPPAKLETDSLTGEVVSCFGQPVNPRDLIRFDGPHEGFKIRANEVVRTARALSAAYAKAARTPVPQIELHQTGGEPMSDVAVSAMIAQWAAARRGENGSVAFTNASIEAKPHGQQPEDLLIAARGHADMDLAHHLGLPAWAVDAPVEGSSLTYSNTPSRSRELIDYCLSGYVEAITARLSMDDVLAAGTWAACSTDVLTDGDFEDRMTAYKAAVDAGVYTGQQLAAREAGQPLEGPLA